jgi:hypothetical protein
MLVLFGEVIVVCCVMKKDRILLILMEVET